MSSEELRGQVAAIKSVSARRFWGRLQVEANGCRRAVGCACGRFVSASAMARHLKSKIHARILGVAA